MLQMFEVYQKRSANLVLIISQGNWKEKGVKSHELGLFVRVKLFCLRVNDLPGTVLCQNPCLMSPTYFKYVYLFHQSV